MNTTLGLLIAALAAVAPGPVSAADTNRFNVLFIAIDDLRTELGCYGQDHGQSPNLDRLAGQGTVFTRHYVQVPTCGASRYAMLTGRSPARSKVFSSNEALYNGASALAPGPLAGAQSLPEQFRRSGYRTVCIGKISHTPDGRVFGYNGRGDGRPELPNAWDELATPFGPWGRGWGAFFAYTGGRHREDGQGNRDLMEFTAQRDEDLPDGLMAAQAIEQLRALQKGGQRFFLGLGFFKPHLPFVATKADWEAMEKVAVPPAPHPERPTSDYWHGSGEFYGYKLPFSKTKPLAVADQIQARRAYLACVRYTDRQVGKVLDALDSLGLAESTIVVLWGDNGWHLGDSQIWGKHTPFERAVHTPLIIRAPGLSHAAKRCDALVEGIDLYPTLLDLCQPAFIRTQHPLDGVSLRPLLDGSAASVREAAISYWDKAVTVRTASHRLIARRDGGAWSRKELYEMSLTPDPVEDLAANQPERVDRLLGLLPAMPVAAATGNPPSMTDTAERSVSMESPTPSSISEQAVDGYFPLASPAATADVFVAADDWPVARIAAGDLAADVERVTGRKPEVKQAAEGLSEHAVLVGTLGKNPVIDRLVREARLDVKDVQGQWESFVIATVADPLPGVKQGLVIAGSDRRGTAYGVYELSKRIGVSPWYWWADVTPAHRENLYISSERLRVGPPAVKYRGIFINDEMWGIRPWAAENFASDEGLGLGPKTYTRIFELLLRLRANYLWPAMHVKTIPFNCYPENKVVADNYAIVMGSSHIEPMLRNNIAGAEWDREGGGEWDYQKNPAPIREYWARRLAANGRYENIYTLGMRGKDDEPMKFDGTREEKIALMERIFADQRELIAKHVNPDPDRVPQAFIPYTEVLGLYNNGMKVPGSVTICWPDDNFGYIRRLPTAEERARPGGSGIYYHLQWLNGATTAYTWLNTTPPSLIWEEMAKAWQYGARNLWVLNVGDIKPGEIGTEFFLEMACDPERYRHDNVRDFLVRWAARDLDPRFAGEIASIMEEYYHLGFTRRPEHLVQARRNDPPKYSWFSHTRSNDEAMQRVEQYDAIARRARAVYEQLPTARKDAFFQLVLYPVECCSLMNRKVIFADKSVRHGSEGRASAHEYAAKARAAADRIIELTKQYNTGLITAGAKWNHMISPAPGPWGTQFRQFEMPPLSDCAGDGPPAIGIALEGGDPQTLADLSVYTQGKRFIDLFNTGKGGIRWTATVSQPWIRLDRSSGTFLTEKRLWVEVDWMRAPVGNDLTATIELTSNAGGRTVTVPVFNPAAPARDAVTGFVESHGHVSMEAEHFTRSHRRGGAEWQVINGLGRSGDSVAVLPATVASRIDPDEIRSSSPSMEYAFHAFSTGEARLDLDCLPTQPAAPSQGVRLAVSLDGEPPRIIAATGGDVLANLRRHTTTVRIDAPGAHTLTVWMVDPVVVLDKLVLDFRPPADSYLGPPESFRGGAKAPR